MHIQSEAEEVIETKHPPFNCPEEGEIQINDLQVIGSYLEYGV